MLWYYSQINLNNNSSIIKRCLFSACYIRSFLMGLVLVFKRMPLPFKGEGQDGGNKYNQALNPHPNPPPDRAMAFV